MSAVSAVASSWSTASAQSYAQIAELGKLARLATALHGKVTSLLTSSHPSTNLASLYLPAYGLARTAIVFRLRIGSTSRTRRKK